MIGYEPRNSGRLRQLRRRDQAPGQRGVAVDVRVGARRQRRPGRSRRGGRTARPSRRRRGPALKAATLASRTCGLLLNLASIQRSVSSTGPGVHPRHEAEGEEVLRALGVAGLHAERLDGAEREARHRHLEHGVALEAAVGEGVVGVARLGEVALFEGVLVDDHRAARLEARQLVAQRGRVHGHQHVRRVARRGDLVIRDVHLEGGDAGQRAGGGPDLGGEVGQRGEVVAEHRAGAREPVAGELHAVAGVAGEADDHPVEPLGALRSALSLDGV